MFGKLGMKEWIIVLVIVALVFGPRLMKNWKRR